MLRLMTFAFLNIGSWVFAQSLNVGDLILTRFPAKQKIEHEVLQVIPAGVVLTILKAFHDGQNQWFWVRYHNQNGWVWSRHTSRLHRSTGSPWRPRVREESIHDSFPIHEPTSVETRQPSVISTGGIYVPTSPNSGFDSNGNHYTVAGNVAIGSHGVTYTISGNVGIGSDGSVVFGSFGQ